MNDIIEQRGVSATRRAESIPGILLPVTGRMLLLPGVSVAEVVEYIKPTSPDSEDVPPWYLGKIDWRFQQVPLLEFETLNGDTVPADAPRQWIAVLNNTGVDAGLQFIAIVLRGLPRLARLTSDSVAEVPSDEDPLGSLELMRVECGLEQQLASLPDVAAMEKAYLKYVAR